MAREGLDAWRIIRLLRSRPPERARTGNRRRTFSAALDQGEELWTASTKVGPASSPIILFYALTQMARALCAAGIAGPRWDGLPGHGLRLHLAEPRAGAAPGLADVRVGDEGRGLIHLVAELLGSPTLPEGAGLDELLCALPEEAEFLLLDETHPRPLQVHDRTLYRSSSATPSPLVQALVGPLPPDLMRRETAPGGYLQMVPPTEDEVAVWFERYPSIAQAGPPKVINVNPLQLTRDPDYAVELEWTLPEPLEWGTSGEWFKTIVDVVTSAPVGAGASGIALPAAGNNAAAVHPLVGWWIVLFAFSMLARYHPRSWVAMLDMDASRLAVPLSLVLEVAERRVPSMMLDQILAL